MGKLPGLAGCAMVAGLLASPPSGAAQAGGVTLPLAEAVGGQRLTLNACAAREALWTDLYVVSVYLPPGTSVAQAATAPSPKLVQTDVTYGGGVPDGLPSSWRDGLQQHVSQGFVRTLQGLYGGLKGSDTARVSYDPKDETSLSVNGREVTGRPGNAVFNAMMQLWVGAAPVLQNIKRLLLQGRC